MLELLNKTFLVAQKEEYFYFFGLLDCLNKCILLHFLWDYIQIFFRKSFQRRPAVNKVWRTKFVRTTSNSGWVRCSRIHPTTTTENPPSSLLWVGALPFPSCYFSFLNPSNPSCSFHVCHPCPHHLFLLLSPFSKIIHDHWSLQLPQIPITFSKGFQTRQTDGYMYLFGILDFWFTALKLFWKTLVWKINFKLFSLSFKALHNTALPSSSSHSQETYTSSTISTSISPSYTHKIFITVLLWSNLTTYKIKLPKLAFITFPVLSYSSLLPDTNSLLQQVWPLPRVVETGFLWATFELLLKYGSCTFPSCPSPPPWSSPAFHPEHKTCITTMDKAISDNSSPWRMPCCACVRVYASNLLTPWRKKQLYPTSFTQHSCACSLPGNGRLLATTVFFMALKSLSAVFSI